MIKIFNPCTCICIFYLLLNKNCLFPLRIQRKRGNLKGRGRIHPTRLSFPGIRKLLIQKRRTFKT